MSLGSEEITLLLDSAKRWFVNNNPLEKRLAGITTGNKEESTAWSDLAQMGWLSLTIPDKLGGMDAGYPAALELLSLCGAYLRPEPLNIHFMASSDVAMGFPELASGLIDGRMRLAAAEILSDDEFCLERK